MTTRTSRLRQILRDGGPGIVPGATDCFTAKLIEQAGFHMVYVTGGGAANTYLGAPDIGLVTLNELAHQAERISDSVTGTRYRRLRYRVWWCCQRQAYTVVRAYERAGVAGLHIEDQVFPKTLRKPFRGQIHRARRGNVVPSASRVA